MSDDAKPAKRNRAKKQGHRSNARGTLRLDVRTPIGRIARASGTLHLPTLNKITAMIHHFGTQEPLRLDILRGVRDLKLDPLIVYESYVTRRLDQLPTTETMRTLSAALDSCFRSPTAEKSTAQPIRRRSTR